jgi:hypothetical protein
VLLSALRTTLPALRRNGLRFRQIAPRGRVRWTLELAGLKRVVLGAASRTLARPGLVRLTLRLSAAGRRALAHRRPKALVLRTRFTRAGIRTDRTATVQLTPPGPGPRT